MNKIITINNFSALSRVFKSLGIMTKDRWKHFNELRNIAHQDSLFQEDQNSQHYNDKLSYSYRLYDFNTEKSLHQFHIYSDRDIGGSSQGQLKYDQQAKHLIIDGTISSEDQDKMTNHPSIGIARRHPYSINCGPFNAINLEIEGDGHPIHVGVEIQSKINGVVTCYGIISSKIKGLRNYELPFENMILVGAQDSQKSYNDYMLATRNQGSVFGKDTYDARRIIKTQIDNLIIGDINIRLLSSKTVQRKVAINNINLVRRAGSIKFMKQYTQPYFYIIQKDQYRVDQQIGISWLTKGYHNVAAIDLGDKKYNRKHIQKI